MKLSKCHVCGKPTFMEPCEDCGVRCCGDCLIAHGKIAVAHKQQGIDQVIIEFMEGGRWPKDRSWKDYLPKGYAFPLESHSK